MAQNFGLDVGKNQAIAKATGYTGDFGSGGFGAWIAGQPDSVKAAAEQATKIYQSQSQPSGLVNYTPAPTGRSWGAPENTAANKNLAAATGYTGDFGAGQYQAWLAGQSDDIKAKSAAALKAVPRADVNGYYNPEPVVAQINPATYTPTVTGPTSLATAGTAVGQGYTPTNWNVDENQTVAGQIKGLIASNSPLNQQTETAAKQAMAAKGLLNSSMAITAGQDALYKNVLPIAQADASMYGNAGQYNATAANQSAAFGADAGNKASLANAENQTQVSLGNANNENANKQFNTGQANTAGQANINAVNAANLENTRAANQIAINKLEQSSKTQLAEIEANYKTIMQTSASAAQLYQQVLTNMTNVMSNNQMGVDAKQKAIDNQLAMLQSGLGQIGAIGNLNLTSILDFSKVPGATQKDASGNVVTPPASTSYTAPDGSVWTSKEAYDKAHEVAPSA